jgi:hypothetical protein
LLFTSLTAFSTFLGVSDDASVTASTASVIGAVAVLTASPTAFSTVAFTCFGEPRGDFPFGLVASLTTSLAFSTSLFLSCFLILPTNFFLFSLFSFTSISSSKIFISFFPFL